MRYPAIELAVFIITFGLFIYFAPYLVTAKQYQQSDYINPMFPIALKNHSSARIIKWGDFKENNDLYLEQVLVVEKEQTYELQNNEWFEIKPIGQDTYHLAYYADDYTFWSQYQIFESHIQPIQFRFIGAFLIIPALLFSAIFACSVSWYFRRRSKTAKQD